MTIKEAVNDLRNTYDKTDYTALLQRVEDLEKIVENLVNQLMQN